LSRSNPPRVLHIASGDLWAGAEVQLYTLVRTLHSMNDLTVSVVLLNHGRLEEELREAGIRVQVLDESQLNVWNILSTLVRIMREIKPAVVHTHRYKENILGSLAGLFAGGVPSIRTVHGAAEAKLSLFQLPKQLTRFFDWLAGRLVQRRIVSVSYELAEQLYKVFPSRKICVIENGIDIEDIRALSGQDNRIARTGTGTVKLGIAGRLVPVKRVDLLIATAHCMQTEHPEFRCEFHIFGDGPLRRELEQLSHRLGTKKIVHFEGHQDDMLRRLQELDALLMTSDHEGLPMILLEAMASRTPVIAHATGGITTLLEKGLCGYLVHEQEPAAYAAAILDLLGDAGRREAITGRAYQRVADQYSATANARAYLAQYRSLSA